MRRCSSRQLAAALERLGCYPGRANRGSHQTYRRRLPDGTVVASSIVLGQRELPTGTIRGILRELHITSEEFERALR